MIKIIENSTEIKEFGNDGKKIEEFIGNVNTKTKYLSIAKISSPQGWTEPGQVPEFDEYTLVLDGILRIETKERHYDLKPGQTVIIEKNTWVKYSSPYKNGAIYMAICLPAFSLNLAKRDKKYN